MFVAVLIVLFAGIGVFPIPFSNVVPIIVVFPVTFGVVTWWFRRCYLSIATVQDVNYKSRSLHDLTAPDTTSTASSEQLEQSRFMFIKYRAMFLFNLSLLFVYPLYTVGFRRLTGLSQLMYVVLHPVLKTVLIEMARQRLDHLPDHLAASTVFTVELMSAMYSALCMGGANSSRRTSLVILALDVACMAIVYWRLLHNARVLFRRMAVANRTNSAHDASTFDQVIKWTAAYASSHRLSLTTHSKIRLEASNGLSLKRLASLRKILRLVPSKRRPDTSANHMMNANTGSTSPPNHQRQQQQQRPHHHHLRQPPQPGPLQILDPVCVQLVRDTLGFMCAMEYTLLVEYVETIIPFMLSLYHFIIFHGPNRRFNLDQASMAPILFHASIGNMLFYGSLELLSLVLCALFKWHFGMQVVYLLGFVLEIRFLDIQGKMAGVLSDHLVVPTLCALWCVCVAH